MFGDGLSARRRHPGDALGDESPHPYVPLGRQQVERSLSPDPIVALGELLNPLDLVRQVGELVHDQVRLKTLDGGVQATLVEHIAQHWLGPELAQRRHLFGRSSHPGHNVTLRDQQRNQPDADHSTGAGKKNSHDHTSRTRITASQR